MEHYRGPAVLGMLRAGLAARASLCCCWWQSQQSHTVVPCQLHWTQGWVLWDGCSLGCRLPQQRLLWKTLQCQIFQPYSCVHHCLPGSPWCMVSQARLAPHRQGTGWAGHTYSCLSAAFPARCGVRRCRKALKWDLGKHGRCTMDRGSRLC